MKLIAANGMKTIEGWDAMTRDERAAWLETLSDTELLAQASVIEAHDARWTVARVVKAWATTGLISQRRATALAARAA